MKAVRVIRTIAFVVAIVALLVAAAGNFFIVKDALEMENVTVLTIREDLENKVTIALNPAKAEEVAPAATEEVPAEEGTEAPTETLVEASEETPVTSDDVTPAEEEAPAEEGMYKEGNDYLFMLMKIADKRVELPFLNCLMLDGEGYSMNLCIMVGFIALTIALLMHLIGKKHSNFWGIVLMIVGYIIFVAFFGLGQIAANNISIFASSLQGDDIELYALFVRAAGIALGIFLGLGYLRCGSYQMRVVRLKKRLKKRAA